jgi:hypothetical protein
MKTGRNKVNFIANPPVPSTFGGSLDYGVWEGGGADFISLERREFDF